MAIHVLFAAGAGQPPNPYDIARGTAKHAGTTSIKEATDPQPRLASAFLPALLLSRLSQPPAAYGHAYQPQQLSANRF